MLPREIFKKYFEREQESSRVTQRMGEKEKETQELSLADGELMKLIHLLCGSFLAGLCTS